MSSVKKPPPYPSQSMGEQHHRYVRCSAQVPSVDGSSITWKRPGVFRHWAAGQPSIQQPTASLSATYCRGTACRLPVLVSYRKLVINIRLWCFGRMSSSVGGDVRLLLSLVCSDERDRLILDGLVLATFLILRLEWDLAFLLAALMPYFIDSFWTYCFF